MKTHYLKSILFTVLTALFTLTAIAGDEIKEEKFKVDGACGMCKSRIEKTLKISEVRFAKWDKKSKMLTVAYKSDAITSDSLQKLVASVGHDTEKVKATNEAYNKLPACCLYRELETH